MDTRERKKGRKIWSKNSHLMPQNKGRDQRDISLIIKCNKLFRHAIKEKNNSLNEINNSSYIYEMGDQLTKYFFFLCNLLPFMAAMRFRAYMHKKTCFFSSSAQKKIILTRFDAGNLIFFRLLWKKKISARSFGVKWRFQW